MTESIEKKPMAFGFDLDGTITRKEILPLIAREVNLYDEISMLTEATIQGIIPFEKSFRLRCRLLKEVPVSTVSEIVRNVPLDQEVVHFIQKHPHECFVISGNLDVWIAPLIEQLGCRFYTSIAHSEGDTLYGIHTVLNKADAIQDIKRSFERIAVIGEGMNDVAMFELADTRIAYGGIHPPNSMIIQLSDYVVMNGGGLCRLLNTLL